MMGSLVLLVEGRLRVDQLVARDDRRLAQKLRALVRRRRCRRS